MASLKSFSLVSTSQDQNNIQSNVTIQSLAPAQHYGSGLDYFCLEHLVSCLQYFTYIKSVDPSSLCASSLREVRKKINMSFSRKMGRSVYFKTRESASLFGDDDDEALRAAFGLRKCYVLLRKFKMDEGSKSRVKKKKGPRDGMKYHRPLPDKPKSQLTGSLPLIKGRKLEDKMSNLLTVIKKTNPRPSNLKDQLSPVTTNYKSSLIKESNKVSSGSKSCHKKSSEKAKTRNANLKQKAMRGDSDHQSLVPLFDPDPINSKCPVRQTKVSKSCQKKDPEQKVSKTAKNKVVPNLEMRHKDERGRDSKDKKSDYLLHRTPNNDSESSNVSSSSKSCQKKDPEQKVSKTAKIKVVPNLEMRHKDERGRDSKDKKSDYLLHRTPNNDSESSNVSSSSKSCQKKDPEQKVSKTAKIKVVPNLEMRHKDERGRDSKDKKSDYLLHRTPNNDSESSNVSSSSKSCQKKDPEHEEAAKKPAKSKGTNFDMNVNLEQKDQRKEDAATDVLVDLSSNPVSTSAKSYQKKDSEFKSSQNAQTQAKNMDVITYLKQKDSRRKEYQKRKEKKILEELENSKPIESDFGGNNLEDGEIEDSDDDIQIINLAKINHPAAHRKRKQEDDPKDFCSFAELKRLRRPENCLSDESRSKSCSPQLRIDESRRSATPSGVSEDQDPTVIEGLAIRRDIGKTHSLNYANIVENIDEEAQDYQLDEGGIDMNDLDELDGLRLSDDAASHLVWLRQNKICFKLLELGQCVKKGNKKCGLNHKRSFEAVMNYFELIKKSSPDQLPLYLKNRDGDQIKRMMSIYNHNSIPEGKQANDLNLVEKDNFFILAQNALSVAILAEKSEEVLNYLNVIINDILKVLSDRLRNDKIFSRLREMANFFVLEITKMNDLEFPEEKRNIFCKKVYAMILIACQNGIDLDRAAYEGAVELFRKQKEAIYACQILKYSRFTPGCMTQIWCAVNSYMVFVSRLDIHEFEDKVAPVLMSFTLTDLQELHDDSLTKKFLLKVVNHCAKMLKKEGVDKVGVINNVLFHLREMNLIDPKLFHHICQRPVPPERDEELMQLEEMLSEKKFREMGKIYNRHLLRCLDQPYLINKMYCTVFETICDNEGQELELWDGFVQTIASEACPAPIERMFVCQLASSLTLHFAKRKQYQNIVKLSSNMMATPVYQGRSFWDFGNLVSAEGILEENSTSFSTRHIIFQILLSCMETDEPEMGFLVCLESFQHDKAFAREQEVISLLRYIIRGLCEKKSYDNAMELFYNYVGPVMRDFTEIQENFFHILHGQLEREASSSEPNLLTEKIIPFVQEFLPQVRVMPDEMYHRDTLRMLISSLGVRDSKGVEDDMTVPIPLIPACQLCVEHDIYPPREDKILPIYHDFTHGEIRGVLSHVFADLCHDDSVIILRDMNKAGKSMQELEMAGLGNFKLKIHIRMNKYESETRLNKVSKKENAVMRIKQTLESFEPKIYFNDVSGNIDERSLINFLASEVEKEKKKTSSIEVFVLE